jgi:aminopeptidase YwaD
MLRAAVSVESAPGERVQRHLHALVNQIGARPPGSPANRRATDYVSAVLAAAGWQVEQQPFRCLVWRPGEAGLRWAGQEIGLEPPPFSRPCRAAGRLMRISSPEQLRAADVSGAVVLLAGEFAAQPIFPKAFPFMVIPEQRVVIEWLEQGQPSAVLAVAGSESPFAPIFEDGDLTFSYATIAPSVADRLASGDVLELVIGGSVQEGAGVNVSARAGEGRPKLVMSAHVDSKATTPGAFDNASGVATLLTFAELFGPLRRDIELVFFNGEDHYAAPGEQAWLAERDLGTVGSCLNLDGVGAVGRATSVSALAATPDFEQSLAGLVAVRPQFELGPPWFESDHAIFAQAGIPSAAITSSGAHELVKAIAHGPSDTLEQVDASILSDIVQFLSDWLASSPSGRSASVGEA